MTKTDFNSDEKFLLRFSHNVIEHLGLKLYQNKPTNVLAELVANSWDADSEHVWIDIRNSEKGKPGSIVVADDGSGMTATTLMDHYLVVGKPKRMGKKANQPSAKGRPLMGRKGIGKLAPFGVAKVVHLLTVHDGEATWLSFDYEKMMPTGQNPAEISSYAPDVICRDTILSKIPTNQALDDEPSIKNFVANIAHKKSGTLVLARNLTLSRTINSEALAESLGRRFTVTLARDDFKVFIENKQINESKIFPPWDLRIPTSGVTTEDIVTPLGKKNIKFWVGFVREASWPQEQAGVGIYAHGKIAQDRPFFFGAKGKEVLSRYLYGVVEADWVDELDHDTISTDRTTIDWDDPSLECLHEWGASKVREWLSLYEKHRKNAANKENEDLVNKIVDEHPSLSIRDSEKVHLLDLLNDVTPKFNKDVEPKNKFVEATMKAWLHDPARRLIQKLWQEVSHVDSDNFALTVTKLADELVPESLSLAVVFAQRVYALTQLQRRITLGKETDLQALIEEFPWILNNSHERFIPRRELKTICEEAEKSGLLTTRAVHIADIQAQRTKPDFVFLGSTEERRILVVELKSPSESAAWPEYEQLHSYLIFLKSRFPESRIEGILVARDFDPGLMEGKPANMTFSKWEEVLARSRRDHMELLAALLAGSQADARDSRVQQICELGGQPVQDFLRDMSAKDSELRSIVEKLKPKDNTK